MRDKYILQIQAGKDYKEENLTEVRVNDESNPTWIDSEYFKGCIRVRIKDYDGLPFKPGTSETLNINSPYFDDIHDYFSLEIVGKFKQEWMADDIVFGNQFEKPLPLPKAISLLTSFATWFDPGLEIDLTSDRPSAFSPLVVSMNTVNISIQESDEIQVPQKESGRPIEEDTKALFPGAETSYNGAERRAQLSDLNKLKQIKITPNHTLGVDFYNPYIDPSTRCIRIPMISLDVMPYWNGEPLRFVCKSKSKGIVFFAILFNLREFKEPVPEKEKQDEMDLD
jgi:hypothetical protein